MTHLKERCYDGVLTAKQANRLIYYEWIESKRSGPDIPELAGTVPLIGVAIICRTDCMGCPYFIEVPKTRQLRSRTGDWPVIPP